MNEEVHSVHAGAIDYRRGPAVAEADLNRLFAASWPNHATTDFASLLRHSLTYVCAYAGDRLVGFVYLAWDGGVHAFLLDPAMRRRGIGRRLIAEAVDAARERGITWVHVDYEPELAAFYRACGFRPTLAGLIRLNDLSG